MFQPFIFRETSFSHTWRVVRSEWWKGISNASYCILWRINITLAFVSWQIALDYNTFSNCNILMMPTLTKNTFFFFFIMPSWSGHTKIRTHSYSCKPTSREKEGVDLSSVVCILELPNLCALVHFVLGMNYMCMEAGFYLTFKSG